MIRSVVFVLSTWTILKAQAYAQTLSHDPGTEPGQANRLMGWPVWIAVGVIIAAALLYTFGSRRGRPRE